MCNNAIVQQLEAAKTEYKNINSQISDLERMRDIAKAKIEAFELSVKYIADMQPSVNFQKKSTRNRMPSSEWKKIFGELYTRYKQGFGYDQIIGVAASLNINLKRPSLRTKMMNLKQNEYVTKISNGQFQIAEKGAVYFGLVTTEKPTISDGDQEFRQSKTPDTFISGVQNFTEEVAPSSNESEDNFAEFRHIRTQHRGG